MEIILNNILQDDKFYEKGLFKITADFLEYSPNIPSQVGNYHENSIPGLPTISFKNLRQIFKDSLYHKYTIQMNKIMNKQPKDGMVVLKMVVLLSKLLKEINTSNLTQTELDIFTNLQDLSEMGYCDSQTSHESLTQLKSHLKKLNEDLTFLDSIEETNDEEELNHLITFWQQLEINK
jgi:hypothetical protein